MNKIGAIIQARVSSTRLPAKVLLSLPFNSNITVLEQVIKRTKKASLIDSILVATTTESQDELIVNLAKRENVKYFRGSVKDVLERYYLAAKQEDYDIVVRITSDCPCIDWKLIDLTIERFLKERADYARLIKIPLGLSVEVMSFDTLEKAHREAKNPYQREHVTPYIYENEINFNILYVEPPKNLQKPWIRITLDTEEDYALLCAVFDFLYMENELFSAEDIVRLFEEKPWLGLINKKIVQKKILKSLEEEIEEAKKILKLQELHRVVELLQRIR